MKSNPCRECGSVWHTAMYHKRKPLQNYKPMARIGRVGKRTQRAMAEWKKDQKPNHQGYYKCFYCDQWIDYLVPEHTKSKVRNPEYRTDKSRLVPTCNFDNERKGSMNAEDYIAKYYPDKLYLLELLQK